jgi:uncharacterized membrane protein
VSVPSRSPRSSERTRAELWVWPGIAAFVALVAGLALTELQPEAGTQFSLLAWPGDVEAASTVLQTIAAAAVSVLTLSFSLTVLAIQLASQQFSPRLLRDFMRDRVTKAVLAALVATFVFTVTVQRRLDREEDIPALAMLVAMGLSLVSLAALLIFINHIVRRLRVDTIMLAVHDESGDTIDAFYPDRDDDHSRHPDELGLDMREGVSVPAVEGGFVRLIDVEALVAAAREHDRRVRVEVRPGDHVVRGTPVATVWGPRAEPMTLQDPPGHVPDGTWPEDRLPDEAVPEGLVDALHDALHMGYERTVEQDAAFGFRQLTDIAVKALSPSINDPVTAVHSIGHMADLLVQLLAKRLGPTLHEDEDGVGRAVVLDRDLRYYLDLACGQIRRYGSDEPTVLMALLRMLRDVGAQARDDHQREEIERQVELVLAQAEPDLTDVDRAAVEDMARRVRQALAGDVRGAYRDRSGETRSL